MSLPFPSNWIRALVMAAPGEIITDGATFRLYYKLSILLLLTLAGIVGRFQFFGDSPVSCYLMHTGLMPTSVSKETLNEYCWNDPVYYKPSLPFDDYTDPHFQYFKWVLPFLCFHIFCFYLPHLLWNYLERDRIYGYLSEISVNPRSRGWWEPEEEDDEEIRTELLALSLDDDSVDPKVNYLYMAKYLVCKWLNTVALALQVTLIRLFFADKFSDYGIKTIQFLWSGDSKYDTAAEMFPKIISCKFPMETSALSVVCFLNFTKVISFVFLVLWFWYGLLMVLTVVDNVLLMGAFFSKKVRAWKLISAARYSRIPLTTADQTEIELLVSSSTFADWFVLNILGNNLEYWILGDTYKTLLHQVAVLREIRIERDN